MKHKVKRVHFVGIGGAGMSGLAVVARALGAEVTGSDRAPDSPYLRSAGIVSAVRSAIGRFGGAFKELAPPALAGPVMAAALEKAAAARRQRAELKEKLKAARRFSTAALSPTSPGDTM